MNSQPCAVSDCPALSVGRLKTCQQHKDCILAKHAITVSVQSCRVCKRKIQPDDWVFREPVVWKWHAETRSAHRHVQCAPAKMVVTKRRLREADKPLFGAL